MSKASQREGPDKRRSTRLTLALPIKVKGVDALHEPFTEQTRTVMVSCHGCKYLSRHYVTKGSEVTIEVPRGNPKHPPREVTAKVIWIQRPNHTREMLHIGLNLDVPGNVWDIPMPPDDWFPPPGEPEFVMEQPPPPPPAPPIAPPPAPVTLTASWDASEILLMAGRAEGREAEVAAALQMAKADTAVAVKDEPAPLREEPEIVHKKVSRNSHETMEEALKASLERLSETAVQKIVERASQHMAEIVQEARKAYEAATEELDSKIHKAVREALNGDNGSKHGRGKRKR